MRNTPSRPDRAGTYTPILCFATLLLAAQGACGAAEFYVSPSGNDGAAGTEVRPFKTPARARDAVRELRRQQRSPQNAPVTIHLRGGTYFLNEPLVLTPDDAGTKEAPVVYAGYKDEKPVVSGGRAVTGWAEKQLDGKDVWAAKVAAQPGKAPPLRSLWVNGRRAVRARTPNLGKPCLKVADVPDRTPEWMKGVNNFAFHEGDLKAWPGLADSGAEIVLLSRWVESRAPLTAVDEAARRVRFGKPSVFEIQNDDRYWVEGLPAFLDEPGEWHFDRKSSTFYYFPRDGEDMTKAEAVVPFLSQVVRLEGKPEVGKFVEHVTFRGITFSHCDWGQGWPGADEKMNGRSGFNQAAIGVPAAIHGDGVRSCVFEDCAVAHVGTYAIELARGCRDNRIRRCALTDLGAGGVKVGETRIPKNEADKTVGNEISDCRITDAGNLFPSAVGVWLGQSSGNRVSHNEIADLYYTGISVGWTWGYGDAASGGNVIEHNHVHHVGRPSDEPEPILSDMGGLYSLGNQAGTVIRNNRFHDIQGIKYGGWGIYYDEGTTGAVSENNVIYRTTHGGFHQHYGKDNVFRNNIIAFGKTRQVERSRSESHQSFTFEKNIVYWAEGEAVVGSWDNYNARFDHNVYWRADGNTDFRLAYLTLGQWREKGMDVHSLVEDPRFVDVGRDDFNLKGDSPAIKLGFQPFAQADVGPRTAKGAR